MGYKETLLQPIMIGGLECKNRFLAQPMERVGSDEEGNSTDLTYRRYENLYKGQFGLVDLETITVTNENRARKIQLEIMPRNEKALEKFIRRLKEVNLGALIVFQLTHSGEISEPKFSRRVRVKPVYDLGGDILTGEEVEHIIDQFALAAKVCQNIGAGGVDMKLRHGYLGSQIIRPYDDRDWKYGGFWKRRSVFVYDLMERIQKAVNFDKKFPIGSKMSMWEGFPGGFGSADPDSPLMDISEPIDLIKGLEKMGTSYSVESLGNVHSSVSFMETATNDLYSSYLYIYFADLTKKALKPEAVVIGSHFSSFRGGKNKLLSTEPEKSSIFAIGARYIEDDMMDTVNLGRQSFADPLTPLKLIEGRENEMKYYTQCMNCEELMIRRQPMGCVTFNKPYAERFVEIRKKMGKLKELHT